ncbi:hypothetical protein GCM10010124_31900 [Pilimelia terevasa]|uniref:SAF domain-containing protein n=1 Tax=Pilimelia terevasa TaxID=53372 RepID=A0A8J3BSW3_9ACTN|nr:SAF domain-containing protein [Pilimelia terevasa]GGK36834.1 hypothetical protein GCM10010124_31900 [Pilimelia terevasa]
MTAHADTRAAGLVAAPRKVAGRRAGRSVIAAAVVAMVLSGLAVAYLLTVVRGGGSYLAVARPVAMGQRIAEPDLVVVRGSVDAAVRPVDADQKDSITGRYAQLPLLAGQLVTADTPLVDTFPGAGKRMVSVPLKAEHAPAQPLYPAAGVQLVEVPAANTGPAGEDGQPRTFTGTVVAVRALEFGGGTTVDVIVEASEAPRIATAAAANRIALVVNGGDR